MAHATHPRLRAGLIGAAAMTAAVAIAIFVVPAAEAPDDPVGCIYPERFPEHSECGGKPVRLLTHEHRETSGAVTRFEMFQSGEWRLSILATNEIMNGCADPMLVRELKALAKAATWKRQHSSTTCDVRPSGTEAWLVDGVEQLAYNICDCEQPDPPTEAVIERMLAVEASETPGAVVYGDCPQVALACYEWLGSGPAGSLPESKFVVEDSGAWELTQRDVQSEEITLHERGVLATAEAVALRDRIAHASWILVDQPSCADNSGVGTITSHGHAVTYGPCSTYRPDRSTQTAIDQLFAIYRSALGSNPHI
jgi:hypothetical protein